MLSEIRELQQNAVNQLLSAIKQDEKDILTFKSPTGSGKTFMMADFMNRLLGDSNDIVFLVSSLSKSDLASQNYEKFLEYHNNNGFNHLNPYLISSEISGEERLHIPTDFNVYLLPRDLYKKDSILMRGPFDAFLTELRWSENKRIFWIKDECHIKTANLDNIASKYFEKTINFSATPNLKRGQHPDVEITNKQAEECKLIKTVEWGDEEASVKEAVEQFKKIRKSYRDLLGVNPCLIIQISNKNKADEELTNEIMPILNDNPELKWLLMVNDKKECNTNDYFKAKKLPVERWKDYAKGNLSGIDIIVFKLVISEGWDIPRACMLYQARNSRSKQLDEQVVGRVRRNPRLMDYETLSPEAKELATTAWVWGVSPKEIGKNIGVKLHDEKSDITKSIRIKTTRIKTLDNKESFNIDSFIQKQNNSLTHKSIFDIHRELKSCDLSVVDLIYDYATTYDKWWNITQHISALSKESNQYRCDYSKSMEVAAEESFSLNSYYTETDRYVNISNWVWKRNNGAERFSFDSDAERDWAEILKDISSQSIESVLTGKDDKNYNPNQLTFIDDQSIIKQNQKEIFLWGKNYVPESRIKFEYYMGALHSSYPDFIMKDKFGRIHIFEVKSVNQSKAFNFDNNIYKAKVQELKKCYRQASLLTNQLFYLPILKDDVWQITLYQDGDERTMSLEQFRSFVKNC